ncbi:hypothetical protein AB0A77_28375 [Streptomyces varsoviensis]|uniref:hypothetical protein n=1 Tax=Streptomyces varsoviensis TaxID=67373 RepID=UPI0034104BEE
MSDRDDMIIRGAGLRVAATYASLVIMCDSLPTPIALPTGVVSPDEMIPAVRRVIEIVDDLIIPEEVQSMVFTACAFYLGALDLFGLFVAEPEHKPRLASVLANLGSADEAIQGVGYWLNGGELPRD